MPRIGDVQGAVAVHQPQALAVPRECEVRAAGRDHAGFDVDRRRAHAEYVVCETREGAGAEAQRDQVLPGQPVQVMEEQPAEHALGVRQLQPIGIVEAHRALAPGAAEEEHPQAVGLGDHDVRHGGRAVSLAPHGSGPAG
ncbi:MAG TPA: hypothetical protein VEA40_07710 [Ramlibacter sp.]|nr:hypothetical protein [Ramlibacter sp.]